MQIKCQAPRTRFFQNEMAESSGKVYTFKPLLKGDCI